ncbi:hypothetical protein ACLD72_003900 [Paenibacillus sp. TH7-28]
MAFARVPGLISVVGTCWNAGFTAQGPVCPQGSGELSLSMKGVNRR